MLTCTLLFAETAIERSNKIYIKKFTKRLFDVGAQSGRAPPLPIPNREVKAFRSDDTQVILGKVGCADIKVPFFIWEIAITK